MHTLAKQIMVVLCVLARPSVCICMHVDDAHRDFLMRSPPRKGCSRAIFSVLIIDHCFFFWWWNLACLACTHAQTQK